MTKKLDLSDTTKLLAHFWSKVVRCDHGPHCDICCWLWQAGLSSGYGKFAIYRKDISAHRFIYSMTYGDILPGLHVLHRCDVKRCVNPHHLWLGTAADNVHDAMQKGRFRPATSASRKALLAAHPEYVRRGERASGAKVTTVQVLAIRRAYKNGQGPTRIAAELGMSRHIIVDIVYRRNWRHLPEE